MPLGSNANKRQRGLELRERKGPLLDLGEFDDINNGRHLGTGYMLGKGGTGRVKDGFYVFNLRDWAVDSNSMD